MYSLSPCKLVGYFHLGVLCNLFHNLQMSAFAYLSSCGCWILNSPKRLETSNIACCFLVTLEFTASIWSKFYDS